MYKLRTHKEYLMEELQDDEEARGYLEVAIEGYAEDHDAKFFFSCLRDVAEARGGLTQLAERTGLNRSNLYDIFAGKNKPRLDTISTILQGLGFQLSVALKSEALPGSYLEHSAKAQKKVTLQEEAAPFKGSPVPSKKKA